MVGARALQFLWAEEPTRLLAQIRCCQQLHRHRRDLGHLRARVALEGQRLGSMRLEAVEGVTRLVEQRPYVRVRPGRIHEDEGALSIGEAGAVAARGLALPAVQVE